MTPPETTEVLQPDDIVPDLSLDKLKVAGRIPADADLLNHQAVATRVTELATGSDHTANIAIFAPWGAGKSSLFGLMEEQLEDRGFNHVTFDAWKHAGDRFQANFLSEVSSQLANANDGNTRTPDPATALYQSRRQLQVPWMESKPMWVRLLVPALILLGFLILPPLLWALYRNQWAVNDDYIPMYFHTLREWVVIALGGSLIVAVIGIIANISQVSVEQSQPSSVKQFQDLFDKILKARAGGRKTVIFIDELDRCEPSDVVATLDGLRTFLQHDDCMFVVAFDRDSVATAIGARGQGRSDTDDSPYYMTAGEFLDKVFQFQVSLPPQTRHTLRAYATRLIAGRGGIWGELRAASPELLGQVIRLLAPAHVGSPRRMKVLLNSYAVNMRLYEGFGFPVIERADAIAVLTVLQTEFPRFAADVEREPELLRAFAWKNEPTRPRLLTIYQQWSTSNDAPDVDRLIGTEDKTARKQTRAALLGNLRSYLDRVIDLAASLPTPDLIHVHAGDDQQTFDDSGVYSALRLARDNTRSVTLSELNGASEHDLISAVKFLEHEIENSDPAEADALRLVIGEILFNADVAVIEHSHRDAIAAWRSRRPMPFPARANDVKPFQGFARVFLASEDTQEFDTFLDNVERVGDEGDVVIEYAVTTATEAEWTRHAKTLQTHTLKLLPTSPAAFISFVTRFDQAPAGHLGRDAASHLITQLFPAQPETPDLTGLPAATQATRTQRHAEQVQEFNDHVAASQELLPDLLNLTLSPGGEMQETLLRAARIAEQEAPTVAEIHDKTITALEPSTADRLLLNAIAEKPVGRGRWLGELHGTTQPSPLISAALTAILSPGLRATLDERVGAARIIATHAQHPDPDFAFAVTALDELATQYLDAGNGEKFEPVQAALKAIDRLTDDEKHKQGIHAGLYVVAATSMQAIGPHTLATMFQTMRSESVAVLEAVVQRLTGALASSGTPSPAVVLTLVAAQRFLIQHGKPVTPLSAAEVTPALTAVPEIAAQWLHTHPRFTDVLKPAIFEHLPADRPSITRWGEYSAQLTETGRTRLWSALHDRRPTPGVLTAVSGGSREVSTALFDARRAAVLGGRHAADKKIAFTTYKALPLDTRRGAVSALEIIRRLAETAVSAEFEIAAYAAYASRKHYRPNEADEVRTLLAVWSPAARDTLLASLRDALILSGMVQPRPKKRK